MKKDNRGLSMVEMIIVVAILSIVAGGLFLGIGMITSKPAEKCANKLVSLMQRNRITTMGKLEAWLEIYYKVDPSGKKYVYVKEVIRTESGAAYEEKETQIGEAGVELRYSIDGATYAELGTSPLKISYDRSSGAFKDYCKYIKIEKGNKTIKLELVQRTGKIIVTTE